MSTPNDTKEDTKEGSAVQATGPRSSRWRPARTGHCHTVTSGLFVPILNTTCNWGPDALEFAKQHASILELIMRFRFLPRNLRCPADSNLDPIYIGEDLSRHLSAPFRFRHPEMVSCFGVFEDAPIMDVLVNLIWTEQNTEELHRRFGDLQPHARASLPDSTIVFCQLANDIYKRRTCWHSDVIQQILDAMNRIHHQRPDHCQKRDRRESMKNPIGLVNDGRNFFIVPHSNMGSSGFKIATVAWNAPVSEKAKWEILQTEMCIVPQEEQVQMFTRKDRLFFASGMSDRPK